MRKYIDAIKSPDDLKKLNKKQLELLCDEIRDVLIDSVSETGGHLAGNLGVVELTVALHRMLNTPDDKIVWDVGHQSYVHKILTGRAEKLCTVRQMGGLSGFCNPDESEYDVTYSGHASASLSSAAGLVQARKLTGKDYNVAVVIGDGAFTGGLSFEALNNIGNLKSGMLIVLNDNEMSISKNVGAFSSFLSRARTNKKYTSSKRKIVEKIKNMPRGGERIMRVLHNIKRHIKSAIAPNLLFEQFGITYLGPVNGHNIPDMEELFKRALMLDEPVLVHVITKKGKGYSFAENSPQKYHGVAPFNKETGVQEKNAEYYSDIVGKTLCSVAEQNSKMVVITPAMIAGSGLSEFSEKFPDRIYDVGIAEGHAVTFAGGIAAGGGVAVAVIYSSFLQRAYDNMIHDVALGNFHVVFAVDRAGFVPGDGATHQGLFDLSYLTGIPNMTVLSPSSFCELEKMLCYAINVHKGPIAVRYPRGEQKNDIDNGKFVLSQAKKLCNGNDVTIVAEGQSVSHALLAEKLLGEKGISAEVIDIRTVKPIDFETVFESALKTGCLYTIEENLLRGGMGEMIAAEAKKRNLEFKFGIKAIEDEFVCHGSVSDIIERYRFTADDIADEIERMLECETEA